MANKTINLSNIFNQQKELDQYIHTHHNIKYSDVLDELVVALSVELGELANEVRCFKFWSFKQPSNKQTILEEYVDGIHFITSLCIANNITNYNFEINEVQAISDKKQLSKLFKNLFANLNQLSTSSGIISWYKQYLLLGYALEFNIDEINQAYNRKNKINHQRQDNKY